jgi:16S rRNA (guanine1207-N2)-methyltransferase
MTQTIRLAKLFDTLAPDLPDTGTFLVLRANDNPAYKRFDPAQVFCIQSFKPAVDALNRAGLTVHDNLPEHAVAVVVELTRSKVENLANIAKGYAVLDTGGTLYIDGAKTDGIDSILKAVKKFAPIEGSYSKAHGKTIWLMKTQENNPFNSWLDLTECTKNKDGYWTVPGIFSADAIDPASALLSANITQPLKGKGADLGAGWGFLSHQALQTYPDINQLDLFEAEQISLDCARKNITDTRAGFHWQDVLSMDTKAVYDFIVMNPPFHVARKADPSLGRDFIAQSARMLTPKGQLWMVANKQLAYEATLDACFNTWTYVEQTPQYKIIHARRPK